MTTCPECGGTGDGPNYVDDPYNACESCGGSGRTNDPSPSGPPGLALVHLPGWGSPLVNDRYIGEHRGLALAFRTGYAAARSLTDHPYAAEPVCPYYLLRDYLLDLDTEPEVAQRLAMEYSTKTMWWDLALIFRTWR